jgi:hypothetical protein
MAHPGFRANDLRAKAGKSAAMARLMRTDPKVVSHMIKTGSDQLAEMGRQVMVASCQSGEPEPVREPAAPQMNGPML